MLNTVLNLISEELARRKAHDLSVILFYDRILQHGKLVCTAARGCRNLIDAALKTDQVFKRENHI